MIVLFLIVASCNRAVLEPTRGKQRYGPETGRLAIFIIISCFRGWENSSRLQLNAADDPKQPCRNH